MTCPPPIPGDVVEAALRHVAGTARFPGGALMIDLSPRLLAEHIAPALTAELSTLLRDDPQPATVDGKVG